MVADQVVEGWLTSPSLTFLCSHAGKDKGETPPYITLVTQAVLTRLITARCNFNIVWGAPVSRWLGSHDS
jgi:hypothetical protein